MMWEQYGYYVVEMEWSVLVDVLRLELGVAGGKALCHCDRTMVELYRTSLTSAIDLGFALRFGSQLARAEVVQ